MITRFFSANILKILNSSVVILWQLLPLDKRKGLAIWIDQHGKVSWFHHLSMAIIRDWAQIDVNAYHHFLWSNHMGYANLYEKAHTQGFSIEYLPRTKSMLFEDLDEFLTRERKSNGRRINIKSVLEVGCSSGYFPHKISRS